jgi:hypothetical protein
MRAAIVAQFELKELKESLDDVLTLMVDFYLTPAFRSALDTAA